MREVFTRPDLTGMSNCWRPLGISAGEADLHGTGLGDRTIRGFTMRIQTVGISVGVSVAVSFSNTSFTLSMGCAPGMSTRNDRATACLLAQSPGIAVSHNVHVEGERLTAVDAICSQLVSGLVRVLPTDIEWH